MLVPRLTFYQTIPLTQVRFQGEPTRYWSISFAIPKAQSHQYRFRVDGAYVNDPINPQAVTLDNGSVWSRFFTESFTEPLVLERWEIQLLYRLASNIAPFRSAEAEVWLKRYYFQQDQQTRNVLSNYFDFRESGELRSEVEPWMFGADGSKSPTPRQERFLTVEYMDLHILKPECGTGIHRHRDNQEIFFMMAGTGIMVMGDWCQFLDRERAFEIRAMGPGSFTLLKAGQLHAVFNVTDEDLSLLMFGGYD